MNTFVGIDLGWYGKPTGLASIVLERSETESSKVFEADNAEAAQAAAEADGSWTDIDDWEEGRTHGEIGVDRVEEVTE